MNHLISILSRPMMIAFILCELAGMLCLLVAVWLLFRGSKP